MKSLIPPFLLVICLSSIARAAWTPNGVPVCTSAGAQDIPVITTDGAGGAIIAWANKLTGTTGNVFAQRIGSDGTPLWTTNGVPISGSDVSNSTLRMVSDGAGGAIIAWTVVANSNVYAQRVNSSGTPQWALGGIPLCSSPTAQTLLALQEDGSGGAFCAWYDAGSDIAVYRVDSAGTSVFANQCNIVTACGFVYDPSISVDDLANMFLAWRSAGTTGDAYAQRIGSDGLVYWKAAGIVVCGFANTQGNPKTMSDGAEGMFAVWEDTRSGTGAQVFANRVAATGGIAWGTFPTGKVLCPNHLSQSAVGMVPDAADGFVALWKDVRAPAVSIYAQRVDAAGNSQWPTDGALVADMQSSPWSFVSDGAGGAIAAYILPSANDIGAQRISGTGSVSWPGGIVLCNAANTQANPALVSDGAGGAIVTWRDDRAAPGASDIYAQHVASNGQIPTGVETPALEHALDLSSVQPNPFSTETSFTLTLGARSDVTIEVFDVAGRRVRESVVHHVGAGSQRLSFDGKDADGHPLASGVYFLKVEANGSTATRKMVIAR